MEEAARTAVFRRRLLACLASAHWHVLGTVDRRRTRNRDPRANLARPKCPPSGPTRTRHRRSTCASRPPPVPGPCPRLCHKPHHTNNVPPGGAREGSSRAAPCRSTGLPSVAAAPRTTRTRRLWHQGLRDAGARRWPSNRDSDGTRAGEVGPAAVPVPRSSADSARATHTQASFIIISNKCGLLPRRGWPGWARGNTRTSSCNFQWTKPPMGGTPQ